MSCSVRCDDTPAANGAIPAADNRTGGRRASPRCPDGPRPIAVVERDHLAIADKWSTLGPLVDNLGVTTNAGVTTWARAGSR